MCGRFTLTVNPADLQDTFSDFNFPAKFAPRFNIAPSQPVLAIPNDEKYTADFFRLGLDSDVGKGPGDWQPAHQCARGNARRKTILPRQLSPQALPHSIGWFLRMENLRQQKDQNALLHSHAKPQAICDRWAMGPLGKPGWLQYQDLHHHYNDTE